MANGKKRGERLALDLSDAEAALIRVLRKRSAGYHQLTISWLGSQWCVEANDRRTNEPRETGYGYTFDEAWGGVAARLEVPERDVRYSAEEQQRRPA